MSETVDIEVLRKKVKTGKTRLESLEIDDKMLRRYMIAYNRIPDAAYEAMVATHHWRVEYNVASLHGEMEAVKKCEAEKKAILLNERDRQGRPVVLIPVRYHNTSGRDLDELTLYMVYMMELACTKCLDDGPDNLCIIYDMTDFRLSCMDYQALKKLFFISNEYYPERLGVTLVLNAPFFFSACWSIIKGWLDERTASKIIFVTSDQLPEHMDPDILPDL